MAAPVDFAALRKRLGLNQVEMAERMGLSSRAWWEIEKNPEAANTRHAMLADMVSMEVALERKEPALATARMIDKAKQLTDLASPRRKRRFL
jgi:DNA-binding XRE family transcriptional regulator